MEAKEKADLELDERIKGAQLAIATESEIQNARRSEIEAIKKTRKVCMLHIYEALKPMYLNVYFNEKLGHRST